MTWSYRNPTQVVRGIARLQGILAADPRGSMGVALVTGRSSAERFGWVERIRQAIPDFVLSHLPIVDAEPTEGCAAAVVDALATVNPGVVIALGGGSVIDVCKVATTVQNPDMSLDGLMSRALQAPHRARSLIAIPTTAGSGSEATPFAVLTSAAGLKRSLPSSEFYPDVAILEPTFLLSLPPKVIADGGLDALAHALEALWSIHRNPISDSLGIRAATTLLESLASFHGDPENLELAERVGQASCQAGFAFSNTFTAACHAISYPLSTRFKLTHGAACAVTLDVVAGINLSVKEVTERLGPIGVALGCSVLEVPGVIRSLRDTIAPENSPSALRMTPDDIDFVAGNVFGPLMANNPVTLDQGRIRDLFESRSA